MRRNLFIIAILLTALCGAQAQVSVALPAPNALSPAQKQHLQLYMTKRKAVAAKNYDFTKGRPLIYAPIIQGIQTSVQWYSQQAEVWQQKMDEATQASNAALAQQSQKLAQAYLFMEQTAQQFLDAEEAQKYADSKKALTAYVNGENVLIRNKVPFFPRQWLTELEAYKIMDKMKKAGGKPSQKK
jgi:hypothetical protein